MTSQEQQSAAAGWTGPRVEELKRLWADGQSGNQIAKALGGVTRNAVIGKVHRLGLAGRIEPSSPSAPRATRPRPAPRPRAVYVAPSVSATPPPVMKDDEPGLATILTLSSHMCRWPIGDPQSEGLTFCGQRRDGERIYCAGHAARAYQPRTPRQATSELIRSTRRYA